jgi:glycosyltransferase involved in cell wall biosynthesis
MTELHDIDVDIVVVDRSGSASTLALIDALRRHHPTSRVWCAWAGDPQFRPEDSESVEWTSARPAEIDLCRIDDEGRGWLAGLLAVRAIIEDGRSAIVLMAGAVAVAGSLEALAPGTGDGVVVVPRLLDPCGAGSPGIDELLTSGLSSSCVAAFGVDASEIVDWLLDELMSGESMEFGRRLDLATAVFPHRRCRDPLIGASSWRWPDALPPVLIEAPNFDAARPWLLDPTLSGPPRVSLAIGDRMAQVAAVSGQLSAERPVVRLPGGIPIDDVMRHVVRGNRTEGLEPWSRPQEFREWLSARYWLALVELRPDVARSVRHATGIDTSALRSWADGAAARGEVPLLIDPGAIGSARDRPRVTGCSSSGVNVVGYLDRQSGVGNVGRRMVEVLQQGGVPHTSIAYQRTINPVLEEPAVCDERIEYATTIACVNGDQIANLRHDHPELFGPGRKVIGYWFWELSTVHGGPPVAVDAVDEIWAATTFMATAFEEYGVPVRVVPIPVREPVRAQIGREAFAPLSSVGDRFVFGVVLDHFSITARKNPLGAIAAFVTAFAPNEGPVLVIKTINGRSHWREHEELLVAAAARPDVIVWDAHLPIEEHMAFIAQFDALVSLHRSEGLGLHLAEAMWMDVPVIATRYSGNLDFMDDSCALLVDADIVAVGTEGGWAYPADAAWADPDLDQAANHMRRLVDEPELAGRLTGAARRRMESQPSPSDVAELVRRFAGID